MADGRRRLLASAGGAIEQLLLFVPAGEARQYAGIYGALIDALPDRTDVTILAESRAIDRILDWDCDAERLDIHDIGDLDITGWARDPLLAAEAEGEPALLISPELARRDDLKAAKSAADRLGIASCESVAAFEGGNILVGRDFLLVGIDTLTALGDDGQERFRASLADFEGEERKIIVVDAGEAPAQLIREVPAGDEQWQEVFHYRSKQGTRQPIFHIDMFVTLAGPGADGRERALVGDPAIAAEMIGMPLHPYCPTALFDAVAGDLSAQGFAVTRNPLPMIYMDEIEQRRRTWFYASSNNVLAQRGGAEGDVVWLPGYGHDHWPALEATDRSNREIWKAMGFEVRIIPGAQRLAENLGGLHCLTNVLRRS